MKTKKIISLFHTEDKDSSYNLNKYIYSRNPKSRRIAIKILNKKIKKCTCKYILLWASIKQDWSDGEPVKDIAENYGVSTNAIYKRRVREKWNSK